MGLEPAFAKHTVAWPLAGIGGWPAEPDDPEFAIPSVALKIGARDVSHKIYLADQNPLLAVSASEPLAPKASLSTFRSRKWLAAVMASCAFHAAVAMFFIIRGDDEQALIAGSANAGITLLGNAGEDQRAAGDISELDPNTVTNVTMITMLDAKPVVSAEAVTVVEPEVVETVETAALEPPVTETIQPISDQPVQPAVADPLPEILATDTAEPVDDDNIVNKPIEAAAVEPIEMAEPAPSAEPDRVVAALEPLPEPVIKPVEEPVIKPVDKAVENPIKKAEPKPSRKPEKKAEQPKKADKAPAKREKAAKAGSGGNGQADSKKGEIDGAANGTTMTKGKDGRSASAGNAAVSNYSGKVRSKLSKAFRQPKGKGVVVVSFVVGANGSVASVRVVNSSGVPAIDKAGLDAVRRAAPFPSIPPEAGRSTWAFTIPLETR